MRLLTRLRRRRFADAFFVIYDEPLSLSSRHDVDVAAFHAFLLPCLPLLRH